MIELRKETYGGSNYAEYRDGELVKRYQLNKASLRAIEREIDEENRRAEAEVAAAQASAAPAVKRQGRYLELASRSTSLNTGKSWIADLSTIERTSCPPEWQGELVCYVYSN